MVLNKVNILIFEWLIQDKVGKTIYKFKKLQKKKERKKRNRTARRLIKQIRKSWYKGFQEDCAAKTRSKTKWVLNHTLNKLKLFEKPG